jgi:hypothetical protein
MSGVGGVGGGAEKKSVENQGQVKGIFVLFMGLHN